MMRLGRSRSLRLMILGGSVWITAAGCQTNEATSRVEPGTAPLVAPSGTTKGFSNDKTYWVTFTPNPDPIPLNKMFSLTVWVCSAKDTSRPASEVTLRADAAMPQHDHGMNTKPKVRANPDGSFTVGGMLFHMPGHWELYLDVTQAGVTERTQFAVELE